MATTYSTRTQPQHCESKSNSDFIKLFGPLEDQSLTTRVVRVPRLGQPSSGLSKSRQPTPITPLMEQSLPSYQEPPMFNSTFATMRSGPYGLGHTVGHHRRQAKDSTPCSSASFPYPTVAAGMPMNGKQYAPNDVATVSPLQTTFDSGSPYGSYRNYDGEPQSAISSRSSYVLLSMPPDQGSRKRNNHESRDESDSGPSIDMGPSTARRRKSSLSNDSASARERYLEKNRRAATKCRSKQKKQQEELVENARDAERKNKILRAEVAILKEDMRELMQVVGEHSHCTDNRLRMYVQREADRLATGKPRSPDVGRPPGRSSDSSRAGTNSQQSD